MKNRMGRVDRLRLAVFIAVMLVTLLIAFLLVVVRIDLLPGVYPVFLEVDRRVKERESNQILPEDVICQLVCTDTDSISDQQTIHDTTVVIRGGTLLRGF